LPEAIQFTERQRNIGDAIAAFMLYVARPFYWHNGASTGNPNVRGASAFILKFGDRFIGVTANHVLQAYLDAKAENPGLICQLSNGRVQPEENIIAQSAELDIAHRPYRHCKYQRSMETRSTAQVLGHLLKSKWVKQCPSLVIRRIFGGRLRRDMWNSLLGVR
jgi:hypothetical protein